MIKVISMVSTYGDHPVTMERKAAQLYAAAASLFALPDYHQVLGYLEGGPAPETPDCIEHGTDLYAVGRMEQASGAKYVRIVTAGGRAVEVTNLGVAVLFRTGRREASAEAAKRVLEHLHLHTDDEICRLELTDGRYVSDADIAPENLCIEKGVLL